MLRADLRDEPPLDAEPIDAKPLGDKLLLALNLGAEPRALARAVFLSSCLPVFPFSRFPVSLPFCRLHVSQKRISY